MTQPPSGWYADPDAPQRERFWDGTKWAARTRLATNQPAPTADALVQRVRGRHPAHVAVIGVILVIVVVGISLYAHSTK